MSYSVALPESVNFLPERGLREGIPSSAELKLVDDQGVWCNKNKEPVMGGELSGAIDKMTRVSDRIFFFSRAKVSSRNLC